MYVADVCMIQDMYINLRIQHRILYRISVNDTKGAYALYIPRYICSGSILPPAPPTYILRVASDLYRLPHATDQAS